MMGYYNLPKATSETIVKGWLKTGDMGYLDEEDYLFVVDRKKEMLLFRGMNVYPREIEEVLQQHPAILEAAVVGAEEPDKGEIPIAFLAPQASAEVDVKELQEFCVARLAQYKVPRRFVQLEEIPKTGSGKINKVELRERARSIFKGAEISDDRFGSQSFSRE